MFKEKKPPDVKVDRYNPPTSSLSTFSLTVLGLIDDKIGAAGAVRDSAAGKQQNAV